MSLTQVVKHAVLIFSLRINQAVVHYVYEWLVCLDPEPSQSLITLLESGRVITPCYYFNCQPIRSKCRLRLVTRCGSTYSWANCCYSVHVSCCFNVWKCLSIALTGLPKCQSVPLHGRGCSKNSNLVNNP